MIDQVRNDEFKDPPKTRALMLLQTNDDYRVLFVEGDSDQKCLSRLTLPAVDVIDSKGRDNVLENSNSIPKELSCRSTGLCDRDFLAFGVGKHTGATITHTDYHDIEIDAFEFGDFRNYLLQAVSREKLEKNNKSIDELIELAKSIAIPIGALRLVNEIDLYRLDFESMKLSSNKILRNFCINQDEVLKAVLDRGENRHQSHRREEIEARVSETLRAEFDWKQIVVGHDLRNGLALVLNKFKRTNTSKVTGEDLKDILLGHLGIECLSKSCLGEYLAKKGYLKS